MSEAREYAVTIQYQKTEDGMLYAGTVREFPDVVAYSELPGDAYTTVLSAIDSLRELSKTLGHDFPEPIIKDNQ